VHRAHEHKASSCNPYLKLFTKTCFISLVMISILLHNSPYFPQSVYCYLRFQVKSNLCLMKAPVFNSLLPEIVTCKSHTADLKVRSSCEIVGFRCGLPELCRLLGCYVALVGIGPIFKGQDGHFEPLKLGLTRSSDTSVRSQPTQRNIPKDDRNQCFSLII
jgi:hypothetical protein